MRQVKNRFVCCVKVACQFGEMCECEYLCEERLHGETGEKLDPATSQIACEMKQTRKKNKTTQGPRKVSSKAAWHTSKTKTETKQTLSA